MDLTKGHFDKQIKQLNAGLDERFEKQTRILMAYTDQQIEKLAAMVADGFQEVKELLDVRGRVQHLEKEMREIKEALNV
jgi:hypothetical protein